MSGLQKNVAGQKWAVFAFDRTDNTPKTGDAAQITANLRIDGGAPDSVDDVNPTEAEDGYYIFDISQAESNGDMILIAPVSSTGDIQVIGVPGAIFTVAPNANTLNIGNGAVESDLTFIHGTELTETSGRLAAAFKKFFDVATPTGSANSLPDAVPDAAGGLPISDAGGLALDDRMISAAATASLEDQYDGTGYVHDTAPATQLQLAGLSGGLAIGETAESSTLTGTGGTETNTYTATQAHGGTEYSVTDYGSGDGISFVMQFDLGAVTATPVTLHLHGWFEDPAGDSGVSIAIQAYDWNVDPTGSDLAGYKTIETLEDGSAEEDHDPVLMVSNVGDPTGSDPGIVRIRFLASGQAAANVMHIDHVVVNYVNSLRTDSNGYVLISDGSGTGQVALTSGAVATDAASQTASKADVSGLATTSALNTHDGKLDTVDGLIDALTAQLAGITLLRQWLGAIAGKQASDATAQTEMRATGAGSGTFDATTDSQEAIVDGASAPSALVVAAAVLDKLLADHVIAGSLSAKIAALAGVSPTDITIDITDISVGD